MDIVIRAAVVFLILFVTRVIGRRELSSLQPFDLILLVVIGDLGQQGPVSFKPPSVRPYLDGEPLIIVQDGKVIEPNLGPRAADPRGGRGGGAPAADRVARRRRVGGAGGEREDQLHPEEITLAAVPLYLSEQDVDSLLTPEDALEAVEGSFRRMAEELVENVPRRRLRLDGGALAVMSAVDLGLGVAGVKTYAAGRGGRASS